MQLKAFEVISHPPPHFSIGPIKVCPSAVQFSARQTVFYPFRLAISSLQQKAFFLRHAFNRLVDEQLGEIDWRAKLLSEHGCKTIIVQF